jgi:UDP-GlcNAc:undecaprenyl-phosphate/decaprenyl-phosphate GlcNAc-1-phosphate transferase
MELLAIVLCVVLSILIAPLVKKIAITINAVDYPNNRKVHQKVMPRLGGVAIFFSFMLGFLFFAPNAQGIIPIIAGGTIILILGIIDDMYQLHAGIKFIGQGIAALTVVLAGIQIDFVTIPFGPRIEFGLWAIPITMLWIIAITNAINLIDGLDGLAAGISSIVLITISGMAIASGNMFVGLTGLMLLGSTLGFLVYNFYPAKIFLGDSGSYFLGFMISVLSIEGLYKNVAVFSILVPIVILGIPIVDTVFAIIRRKVHGRPFYRPDKYHLHHCLLRLGYSHRQSVLILYGISTVFSLAAIVFSRATMFVSITVFILLSILIELIVEITGLVSKNYKPLLNLLYGNKRHK